MVVPVLITNCYVSEKWKSGPDTAQTTTTLPARIKVLARPAAFEVQFAALLKALVKAPESSELRDMVPSMILAPHAAARRI